MGRSQPRFASRSRGVLGSLSRRKLFVEFERIVGTVSYVSRIAKSAKLQIICNDYCKDWIFSFFFFCLELFLPSPLLLFIVFVLRGIDMT